MARTAWVTGAGRGIGREVARRLAQDGWTVAASARNGDELAELAGAASGPGRVVPFVLDITDEHAVRTVRARIEAELGLIDLAILNAGTHAPVTGRRFEMKKLRKVVEVNMLGTGNCLAALLPSMVGRQGGHVAVVASVAGYRGLPSASGYAATKAGLIAMCEALKPELERENVRLTLINPGFVDTPLTKENDFPMPFMISAEEAGRIIVEKLDRAGFEIVFPFRMALAMKLLRILPYRLFFAVTRRMVR